MVEKYSDKWLAEPLWHVELDDGTIITQDEPEITWLKLHDIIEQRRLSIVRLWVSFRDKEISPIPDGSLGYFFGKNEKYIFPDGVSASFYMVGHLNADETINVGFWKIPELEFVTAEIRQADDKEKTGLFLIRNPVHETAKRFVKEEIEIEKYKNDTQGCCG